MGIYKAWSTMEVVELTGKKRSSVLKRLHKLEGVDIVEKRIDDERRFYWLVLLIPDKPTAPKLWKESKSIYELETEEKDVKLNGSNDKGFGIYSSGASRSITQPIKERQGISDGPVPERYGGY
jgi:hypothetical protein